MALTLKNYQIKSLEALDALLVAARGARTQEQMQRAFASARRAALGESAPVVPYRVLSTEMPEVPQVCIRIPTGGGKTLLAAHAIEHAARLCVGTPAPIALWLVPTDIIRKQTLNALKTPGHDYREALLSHYAADRLMVLDATECDQIRAQDLGSRAIVIVTTMQTFRVEKTAKRDVYDYKESFEPHFAAAPDADFFECITEDDLVEQPYLKRSDIGKIKKSFANLLAWHRPIVIVDEAHNATSNLSGEVLKRIRPACVIEWTATPARDQNVLYHVSAQELKSEDMIKLPIVLSPHPNWQEAVRDAVLTRQKLAEVAAGEDDYIRPIVLFQADAINGEVPFEKLKSHLNETLHIDATRIALATGTQRELAGINLFDRACPIDFVITVEALKEGWDCSFAYVFCTVQKIRSAKDMEQLLGRVLRLPYAKPRRDEKLNRAYAHVCAPSTVQVANELADRLVSMGFQQVEAAIFIQPQLEGDLFGEQAGREISVVKSSVIVSSSVAEAIQRAAPDAEVRKTDAGMEVTVTGILSPAVMTAAMDAAKPKEKEQLAQQLERHQAQAHAAAAPSQRGQAFAPVPQLVVALQGELVLYEPEVLGELAEFSLAGAPHDVLAFGKQDEERPYLIDVERGKLKIAQDVQPYVFDLNTGSEGIRREDVIRELDRRLRNENVLQADMIAWLGKVLDGLLARGIELTYCARHMNRLADAIAARIAAVLADGRIRAFQQSLLTGADGKSGARLDAHHHFEFKPGIYPARWYFNGRYNFNKHYYPLPGELNDDLAAEETACAIALDEMSEVVCWVRNLERQALASFWLPTSTDRFYPDFVAQLKDGRILVVEYKGAHLFSNEDSKEKRTIGSVWAAASAGKCVFAMVTDIATAGKSVAAQLKGAVS